MITFVSSVWCIYCKNNIVEYVSHQITYIQQEEERMSQESEFKNILADL